MDGHIDVGHRLAGIPDPVELLEGIFAHAPVGFQIYTPDGHSVLTNRAFLELFGSAPPPEYNVLEDEIARRTGVLELIHRAFRGETVHVPAVWYDPREITQVHAEAGRRVAMESTFFPLFGQDGSVRYVAIVFKDVTAERLAEERARFLSEAGALLVGSLDYVSTLQEVARLATAGFANYCVIDVIDEGSWRRVAAIHQDRTLQPLLDEIQRHYPAGPDSPHPAARAIRSGEPELLIALDEATLSSHTVDQAHRELVRRMGLRSHLAVPLLTRGRAIGGLSLGRGARRDPFDGGDVQLAMELGRRVASAIDTAQLYHKAQEAIFARDEFLSVASHELKTPLTPLRLQVEMLQTLVAGDGSSPVAVRLKQVERQTARLARLIESLLDVSRISVGRLSLDPEELDLAQLVREMVERSRDEARRAVCAISLEGEPTLTGFWDRMRLEQVIANLISNALKYGAGAPIEIALRREQGSARLTVRDHGIGIAPEDQERIFARFERAASIRHYGGLGLGLYIARQIVEAHGGSIGLSSPPGEGSAFTVTLPLGSPVRPSAARP